MACLSILTGTRHLGSASEDYNNFRASGPPTGVDPVLWTAMVGAERSVHDAEEPSAGPADVPAAHHRTGAERARARELGRQFEPSAQAIRNWVRQADRDDGRRQDGLTTVEPDELRR